MILGMIAGSGEFRAKYKTGLPKELGSIRIAIIEGVSNDYLLTNAEALEVDECTLLARPLSSLIDEEWKSIPLMQDYINKYNRISRPVFISQLKSFWNLAEKDDKFSIGDMMYLLSIGVLPEFLADENVEWV